MKKPQLIANLITTTPRRTTKSRSTTFVAIGMGGSRRGAQGHVLPPNQWPAEVVRSGRFCWICRLDSKMHQNMHEIAQNCVCNAQKSLALGSPPQIPLGELTTLPKAPSWWEGGKPLPRYLWVSPSSPSVPRFVVFGD